MDLDQCLSSPILCEKILVNLDNQSLVQCRLVCKKWKFSIDNDFTLWTRMLWKSVLKEFENLKCIDTWKKVLQKISIENITLLAKSVNYFENNYYNDYDYYYPPHYAVSVYSKLCDKNDSALLTLYKHIAEKTQEYNVEVPNIPTYWGVRNIHKTALHNFAGHGHQRFIQWIDSDLGIRKLPKYLICQV